MSFEQHRCSIDVVNRGGRDTTARRQEHHRHHHPREPGAHLVDRERQIGGFFEELLDLGLEPA
jgi:hypothetical protein